MLLCSEVCCQVCLIHCVMTQDYNKGLQCLYMCVDCRHKPLSVQCGIGQVEHDDEGRVVTVVSGWGCGWGCGQ